MDPLVVTDGGQTRLMGTCFCTTGTDHDEDGDDEKNNDTDDDDHGG